MSAANVRRAILSLLLLALVAALPPATGSAASWRIKPGSVKLETLNSAGEPELRAGSHPDRFKLYFDFESTGGGSTRDLQFDFAPGMTGSPLATETCLRTTYEFQEPCAEDTEVGLFHASFLGGEGFDQPVINLPPGEDEVAALSFRPFWQTELELSIRPTDFGLSIAAVDLPQLPFSAGYVELWGVPGDHNHAPESQRKAFLTMPTTCKPLKFSVIARSWEPGSAPEVVSSETAPFEGCEELPFEPSLGLQLTSTRPDSPTGAKVDLNLPDHSGPDERVSASLKDVSIEFPPGLSVSPSGVQGRATCSDEEFGLGLQAPATCPFGSRVGTVEVATTALAKNLVGSIYLGREHPGERFRLFIEATAPGVDYKSVAKLEADPQTGQLSAALSELPQFTLSRISLAFEGGSHALLATPIACGPARARARFVPYSGAAPIVSPTTVNIGTSSCGTAPFSPGLTAGAVDPVAGKSTPFAVTLSRQEGEDVPAKFTTTFPPGVSANLNAVDLCSRADADAGHCPASSKIGDAVGEVGAGPTPAHVPGAVYLTESYRGAPFGLSIAFKAAIGPFDFGTLNVRAKLSIDPITGQISIEHVLPSVFEGVPLRFRTIGIDLNRPNFIINPTSCEPEVLDSTVYAPDGRAAPVPDGFQVGGCGALGFKPKFAVALDRRGSHAKNPQLSFAVRMGKGETNVKRLDVRFPRVLRFHQAGLKEVCARATAEEGGCRATARVGSAEAVSPLLRTPLRGPVYLVQPQGKGFPELWSDIEGQFKLELRSKSTTKHGTLTTEMVDIPDLPLSSFRMNVEGGHGKGALFTLKGDPCAGSLATPVELEGHDGAARTAGTQMKAGCPKKSRRSKRIRGRRSSHKAR